MAAGMGITSEVLETLVPFTCKTGGEDRNSAALRELLSAADKLGVHFWSYDNETNKRQSPVLIFFKFQEPPELNE